MAEQNTNPIDVFVEQLITEAGFSDMADDFKAAYTDRLRNQVYQRLGIIALSELNDADLATYTKILEDNPEAVVEATVQQFFETHIPDFSQKVDAGLAEFANEFLVAAKANLTRA